MNEHSPTLFLPLLTREAFIGKQAKSFCKRYARLMRWSNIVPMEIFSRASLSMLFE